MKTSHFTYQTTLSGRFLLCTVGAVSIFACGLGILARNLIILAALVSVVKNVATGSEKQAWESPPIPMVRVDRIVPHTVYTTMIFDTSSSVISSRWLQNKKTENQLTNEILKAPDNVKLITINNGDGEDHQPSGQHLLIDIDGVDGGFLNSDTQLATAMLEMVDSIGLTLLSYHCHSLQPLGVTCVGVLLESHVALHTWPNEGVITLDLFTCGANSLLKHLQLIRGLFAVHRRGAGEAETPQVIWAYKHRGFNEKAGNAGSRDTFAFPLGIRGIKKDEVGSIVTDQGIQGWVYDIDRSIMGSRYADSPSRFFYLDGVLQASSEAGTAFYESFVHPSMLAHLDPKRALVFGSTTGATVKELLKHKSVEDIVLVGAVESILSFAKRKLFTWNDCSDVVSVEDNCLDDSRVDAIYDHPNTWLPSYQASSLDRANSLFDIIMVDFFELQEEVALDILDNSISFLTGLKRILTDAGILILNISGEFRSSNSQVGHQSVSVQHRSRLIRQTLEALKFVDVKQYALALAGFPDSKNFIVAFMDADTAKNWNRNEAQVNRMIRDRCFDTKSGKPPLKFFDGSTMVSYSKFKQGVDNCTEHPNPRCCDQRRHAMASNLRSLLSIGEFRSLESVRMPNTSDANLSINEQYSQCKLGGTWLGDPIRACDPA